MATFLLNQLYKSASLVPKSLKKGPELPCKSMIIKKLNIKITTESPYVRTTMGNSKSP